MTDDPTYAARLAFHKLATFRKGPLRGPGRKAADGSQLYQTLTAPGLSSDAGRLLAGGEM